MQYGNGSQAYMPGFRARADAAEKFAQVNALQL
jgi:hypothetical protein